MTPDPHTVTEARARSLAHEYGYEASQIVVAENPDYAVAAQKYRHAAQFAEALDAGLPGGDD